MKEKGIEITEFIGRRSCVKGTLTAEGSIRIDGTIDGEIKVKGTLLLGKEGYIKGTVNASNAIIRGKVEGNLYVTKKVELQAGANIKGDITCAVLVVEEGATFNGNCKMGEPTPKPTEKLPTKST